MDWVRGPLPDVMEHFSRRVARDQRDFAEIRRSVLLTPDGGATLVYGSRVRCPCGELRHVSGFTKDDRPIVNCDHASPGEPPFPVLYANGATVKIERR